MKKILHSTWKQFQKCRYWKDLEGKENLTKMFKGYMIILRRDLAMAMKLFPLPLRLLLKFVKKRIEISPRNKTSNAKMISFFGVMDFKNRSEEEFKEIFPRETISCILERILPFFERINIHCSATNTNS